MRTDSRVVAGFAALAAAIASAFQLWERDWLVGTTGLAIAGALAVIATGLPDRSRAGKWLGYGLLAVAFVLQGMRVLRLWTRV